MRIIALEEHFILPREEQNLPPGAHRGNDREKLLGFDVIAERGVFPTVPIVTSWIRRKPADRAWLHRALTAALPWPSLSFLAIVTLRRR